MSTLTLNFEGWYQMRMATDPDPTDEKRGVSGYTFALAGEPDLDAKVHLQPDEPGVWQRKFGPGDDDGPNLPIGATSNYGPRVGVTVTSASDAEYVGARVAFLDAQILEHNGVLVRNDYFFIDPLHVRIFNAAGETLIERRDWVNPSDPSMPLWEATSAQLIRRQPTTMQSNSPMVALATGLPDASNETCVKNRLERQANLKALLKKTRDPAERAALTTRIEQLAIVEQWWNLAVGTINNRPIDRRAHQLTLLFDGWNIGVNGNVYANKPGGDPSQEWPLSFWMGGWDGDALCAYIRGTWQIPLK
ncbi:MAG: hypothetical protein ACJ74H_00245 [Thermoanaerobaculia bacterium]